MPTLTPNRTPELVAETRPCSHCCDPWDRYYTTSAYCPMCDGAGHVAIELERTPDSPHWRRWKMVRPLLRSEAVAEPVVEAIRAHYTTSLADPRRVRPARYARYAVNNQSWLWELDHRLEHGGILHEAVIAAAAQALEVPREMLDAENSDAIRAYRRVTAARRAHQRSAEALRRAQAKSDRTELELREALEALPAGVEI